MRNSRLNKRTVKQQKKIVIHHGPRAKDTLGNQNDHHNATVPLKVGCGEALSEGVGDHKVGTQRHELN